MLAQKKSLIKLNVVENKFDIGDLFMKGENHLGKTPPGEFKVTTPKIHYYQNKRLQVKEISEPNTNLQLNPYPNTQLDL